MVSEKTLFSGRCRRRRGLFQNDAADVLFGRFVGLLFARGHRLVGPIVGRPFIVGLGCGVTAGGVIGFAEIQQVQVDHGVVIVLALVDRRLQHLHAFLDKGGVFAPQLFTELLVGLGLELVFHSQAGAGSQFRGIFVGLGPVDDTDRGIEFGVIGVYVFGPFVVLTGIVEPLHVQIKVGNPFHAIDAFRLILKHPLILFNRLLGPVVVFLRLHTGHVLLGIGRGQIQFGHFEVLVVGYGILEVLDGLLVICALISTNAFIELVARSQFVAPRCTQQRGCDGQQRRKSCASVHFSGSLPELENFWVLQRTTAQGAACCAPHAKESKNHWPSKIFFVISPTRSTTWVPRPIPITWSPACTSLSSSPSTTITP